MESLDYLGREHFVDYGELYQTEKKVARDTFSMLVGRIVIPRSEFPDFQNIESGLVVVHRADTDLGELPEYGRYARSQNGYPVNQNTILEEYAVGTLSLKRVINHLIIWPADRPERFNDRKIAICNDLVKAAGIIG